VARTGAGYGFHLPRTIRDLYEGMTSHCEYARFWPIADIPSAAHMSAFGGKADMPFALQMYAYDPSGHWVGAVCLKM